MMRVFVALAWVAACTADDARFDAQRSAEVVERPLVRPQQARSRLVVKFADRFAVRTDAGGGLHSARGESIESIREVAHRHGLRFRPMFRRHRADLTALLERAQARSGRAQPDLLATYVIEAAHEGSLLAAGEQLQQLDAVEFVAFEGLDAPPPTDLDPPTPDHMPDQGHLDADPGIDVRGAWALGYDGSGIRISDVERGWNLAHEEWLDGQIIPEPGQTPDEAETDLQHGTAVAGTIIAPDNGYGVTGIAKGNTLAVYSTETIEDGFRGAEAVATAFADAGPGEIVLLEMQGEEPITGRYGPVELDQTYWMLTRVAADAGVVVVAAAGNGELDLDSVEVGYWRDWGDSGAIIVGAGQPGSREPESFSSYGSRVDVQGWGSSVFTAGYGDHAIYGDDINQAYTDDFGGTSSASAVIATRWSRAAPSR
jgi:hypothetical protein